MKRIGRFKIKQEDFENMPEVIRRLMAGMVVVRAEMSFSERAMIYEADSGLFEQSEPATSPREYMIEVVKNRFVAQPVTSYYLQRGLWELFEGKSPILIEQESTCFTVRVSLDMLIAITGVREMDAVIFAGEVRNQLATVPRPGNWESIIERAREKMKGTQ